MENYSVKNAIFDILRIFSFVITIFMLISFELTIVEFMGLFGCGLLMLKDIFVNIVKDVKNG